MAFKLMAKTGKLINNTRTKIIKTLLRTQLCLEGSTEAGRHCPKRNAASYVSAQFFPAFLSFPKEKNRKL